MRGRDIGWGSVLCDIIVVAPFFVWAIVSLSAIPSYAALQWFAPVACAVVTIVMGAVATFRLFKKLHTVQAVYMVQMDEGVNEGAKKKSACRTWCCRYDTWLAIFCALVSVVWAILCFATQAQISRIAGANRELMPCGGECSSCTTDPHCTRWSAYVLLAVPLSNICPPAVHSPGSTSDVTFSCAADGGWMVVTAAFCVFWMLALLRPGFRPGKGNGNVAPTTV